MRQALSILAPLGWMYGLGAAMRREAYARGVFGQQKLRSPVISVGGLALGGSMKTPVVVELARVLASRGPKVGVVGHGYRGATEGPCIVSDGQQPLASIDAAGDEAVLMAHELPGCPVVVGRDKAAAGRALEEKFGKRIIVVDSGFQHLRLYRDIDIVCVTEADLGDGVLPSGFLREFPRSLNRAHIVFTDRRTDGSRVERLRASRPRDVFSLERKDFGFFPIDGSGEEVPVPEKIFVFCGIGRPEAFMTDLRSLGAAIVGKKVFRDHHRFTEAELKDLAKSAESAGALAAVVTTKDAVRIHAWPGPLPLLVLGARLDIEGLPQVLKRIDSMILARIKAGH